jgi:hypothetical protein
VSPKAVKDILMTRELVKQTPTKTGNASVDQEITDAKNLAVESLKNWASLELYSDLLIAKESDDKNVPAALRVISGSKYATDKVALQAAFDQGVQIGPKLGNVNMIVAGWLGPEVISTVARLIGFGATP